jgi:hypothetical protein
VTESVNTSQASGPAFEGGDFGPLLAKHCAPRSPSVYVPPANVAPVQLNVVAVLLTDPLAGVAARAAGDSVVSKARTMVMTQSRRKAASLRAGSQRGGNDRVPNAQRRGSRKWRTAIETSTVDIWQKPN